MTDSSQQENQEQAHEIPGSSERRDGEIQDAVVNVLASHPGVNAPAIQVSVQDGIVTLRGLVLSPEQRRRAEVAVSRVAGVRAVQNLLKIGEL
jgi:osmotically-inducible protein OsmY